MSHRFRPVLTTFGLLGKGAMTPVIETYELSPMQAGMLFHSVRGGYPGIDIEQVVATLHEPLDEAHFLRAWQRVAGRHPVLRSCFRWKGVAEPMQDVVDRVQIPVERFDWRALAEAERHQRFQALLDHDRARGFDLGQAPLMRLALVRAAEREHWVLWTFHHALLDGQSYPLVLREVFAFYEAFSLGEDADLPLPRPYRDHIEWLRKLDHGTAKSYWQSVLSGFRAPTPLVVALDREAQHVTGGVWGAHEIRLPAALTTALRERAREASVTLNNLLQGAWALLLHRYSGEPDIVFGATRACRRSAVSGADDMVGLFINTLPIRVSIDPEARLIPWLQQLRAQQVALREYEHTPLVKVQGWSDVPRGMPLFESILVFENQTLDAQLRALGDAWSERRFLNFSQAGFPLALIAWGDDELVLQLDYSRRRFADDVVARMLGHLQTLLEGMAAHPQARLRDLPLLTAAERHQLLVEWNDTDTDRPADALLHNLFEAQAARTPDAVAVVSDGRTLSYGGLDRRANQLAHALRKRGVGPDVLVGLCVDRTPDMIVALLGIFKAGGAYVPLDPEYPADRLAFMLEDCGAKVLITEQSLRASLPPLPADSEVIYLDRDVEAHATEREDALRSEVDPSNLAYAIYTSGSTGQPKAALLTHRGLLNLAVSEIRLYGIGPQSRVLQSASLSFDASVSEIAMALCSGGALYVERRDTILPGPDLERYLEREKITVLSLTPSALAMLDPTAAPSVEQLIVGGEPCSAELAARWAGRCRFFNTYGPTETTVTTTYVEYRDGALPPLIGRPLPNVRVYLLDQALEPVPVGVTGEIYIGGIGVARGYLGRPKLSAERFLPDPFRDRSGALMYRTGDFGRWRSDGQIEFMGRIDDQVKIRGFRIELGEIEANLAEHPDVRQAAVHLWTVKADDVRIVACCVPAKAGVLAPISLRKHLRARLPEYMIPQHFLLVDEIPLTPNGKVDRRRLPTPIVTESRIGRYEAPLDPIEATIADIWTKLIHPARPIGRIDSFFEMGGHSLLGLQALGQIEDKLGMRLDLRVLFQESLADIATRCRSERIAGGGGHDGAARPVALAVDAEVLLSENQERIYRAWLAEPGGLQYHVPFSFRLKGALNAEVLSESLRAMFTRHPAIRTVVRQGSAGPIQKVMPLEQMCVLEFSDVSDTADPDAAAMSLMVEQTKRPFDLAAGPVVRMRLIKLGDQVHLFFFMPHQIIFDEWSFDLVLNELNQNYALLETGRTLELKALELRYGDFTTWQRQHGGPANDPKLMAYWQDALRDLPLPIEWCGGPDSDARVQRVRFVIARDVMARYEAFCNKQKLRPQTLVLAAFAQVLGAALGRSDLLIGLATSGRFTSEVAPLVGLFFSNVPVRLRLPGSQRAGELLEYVQSTVQGSIGFQDISRDQLVQIAASMDDKDRLKHQVAFSFQDVRNQLPVIGSLGLEQISVSRPDLENDLEFWVRNTPSGLVANLDYRAHIAAHALVESLRDDCLRMLERLTESPSASVEGIVKTRLMHEQDVPLGPSGQQGRKGLFGRLKDRMA